MYHQYMDTFSQVRRPGRSTAPVVSPVDFSLQNLQDKIGGFQIEDLVLNNHKREKRNGLRTAPRGEAGARGVYIRAHFSKIFQQYDHNHTELCFKFAISRGNGLETVWDSENE